MCLACIVCALVKLKITHALYGLCVHGQFAVGWVTYVCTEFEACGGPVNLVQTLPSQCSL